MGADFVDSDFVEKSCVGQEASRALWVSDRVSLYNHPQASEPDGAGQLWHLLQFVLCSDCYCIMLNTVGTHHYIPNRRTWFYFLAEVRPKQPYYPSDPGALKNSVDMFVH